MWTLAGLLAEVAAHLKNMMRQIQLIQSPLDRANKMERRYSQEPPFTQISALITLTIQTSLLYPV